MRTDLHFPATFLKIFDQLFTRFELRARRLVAIEITDETNPESDVVHVIAVNVAPAHLLYPAVANLDLAVARGSAVADDEVISEPVLHPTNVPMIIIEHPGASLPRAAVVDDDEFPARALDWRAADRVDVRAGEVTIIRRLARERPPAPLHRRRRWRRFVALLLFESGFFDGDVGWKRSLRLRRPR